MAEPHELHAPVLLWSEAASVLHELRWRHEISPHLADLALLRLRDAPVVRPGEIADMLQAWQVADALGWAKTYDAEYVALAERLGCPLVTLDGQLRLGAGRLVSVRTPAEIDDRD